MHIDFLMSCRRFFEHKPSPRRKVKPGKIIIKIVVKCGFVLTFTLQRGVPGAMMKWVRFMLLGGLLGFSASSFALSESEAEDMADLTAVFVFFEE